MNRIIFLGSGGGRTILFTQLRHTGGIYLELDGKSFLIDPGPGSLYHARKLRLKVEKLNAILLSHRHVDHSNDVNAYLDGLTNTALIAEKTSLTGDENDTPVVSKYHQEKTKSIRAVVQDEEIALGDIKIKTTLAEHTCPTIGFIIEGSRKIGYTSDTVFYDGIEKYFDGVDVLIANVLVPHGKKPFLLKHLSVDDVVKMVNRMTIKPELIIITHLSMWMLKNSPYEQARFIQKNTGVKTIAAKDNMEINLDTLNEKNEKLKKFL